MDFSGCEPEVFSAGFDGFYDLMFEGSTAITDFEGNLLFFTNGERVYNADYQLMPSGLLSGGIFSFTQTLIVRQPGSNSLYYLFYRKPNSPTTPATSFTLKSTCRCSAVRVGC